ncbi:MAG: 4-hydroxy-3-methylbut-2-enyl diphosphate reductase [Thermomicrobiales bacterium]
MKIILADEMGFCFGVRRAIEMVDGLADEGKSVRMLGDVVHNPQVVRDLEGKGVSVINEVHQATADGVMVITAHGAAPWVADEARAAGTNVVDTTCPLVEKPQQIARDLANDWYTVVVYGDKKHPEVKGILGWAGEGALATKRIEDLPWHIRRDADGAWAEKPPRKVAVVTQTTSEMDDVIAFVNALTVLALPLGGEVRVINTICKPTTDRQLAMRNLAREADVVLVIGGRKSANTRHLAEIGNHLGTPSYHIESTAEIDPSWIAGKETVGVTAGASTPDAVVGEVVDWLIARGGVLMPRETDGRPPRYA